MSNIFLIGFMGCGKSTVAVELQKLYELQMCEMDQMIVDKAQMDIPQIFEVYGESYFRDLETEVLNDICKCVGQVVSCGGGIVLREINVSKIKECGSIVLLTARPETILARVGNDNNRPILKDKKNIKDISELMEKRQEKYIKAADVVVETDDKSVREICEEIIDKLNKRGA